MEKFKIGNNVLITKPTDWKGYPTWTDDMDHLNGSVRKVSGIIWGGQIELEGDSFVLHPDWCSLLQPMEIQSSPLYGTRPDQEELEDVTGDKIAAACETILSEDAVKLAPKMRVYIAGKISGLDAISVSTKFAEAADKLRSWGFEPISPLDYCEEGTPWVDCMLTLLPVLRTCQGIYLLDNWSDSDGAKVEKLFAEKMGLFLIGEVL